MNAKLVEGNIGKTLIKLTVPMIFGMLGMVAFNLIDTYFVGQLGTTELAALSFTFPIVMGIVSLSVGIGVGATAVVANEIGAGNMEKVKRLTTDSMLLSFILVVILAIAGLLTIDPLFRVLGASDQIIELIKQYMIIWYAGVALVIIPMVGNSIIRATGDTKTPSTIMMIAVGVNIILDPILIFGFGPIAGMGLTGAAIATLISRFITFLIAIWVLFFREKMITFKFPSFKIVWASWKSIMHIAIPSGITRMAYPVVMGILLGLIASFGEEAVAAFGVGSRIEFFSLVVPISLATVIGPFVGQNKGAKKHERVKIGISLSERFALIWGVIIFGALALLANPIAGIFSEDPKVIHFIVLFLYIMPIGYGAVGALQIGMAALNAVKKPYIASIIIGIMFVIIIPSAYIGAHYLGIIGILFGITFAYIIAGISSHFITKKYA